MSISDEERKHIEEHLNCYECYSYKNYLEDEIESLKAEIRKLRFDRDQRISDQYQEEQKKLIQRLAKKCASLRVRPAKIHDWTKLPKLVNS